LICNFKWSAGLLISSVTFPMDNTSITFAGPIWDVLTCLFPPANWSSHPDSALQEVRFLQNSVECAGVGMGSVSTDKERTWHRESLLRRKIRQQCYNQGMRGKSNQKWCGRENSESSVLLPPTQMPPCEQGPLSPVPPSKASALRAVGSKASTTSSAARAAAELCCNSPATGPLPSAEHRG